MESNEFANLEEWFHRLADLNQQDRDEALEILAREDPDFAARLVSMTSALTSAQAFLDADTLHPGHGYTLEILTDGSVTLSDRYTLIEQIGSGGSGSVFRARASNPERDVAVKMLRLGLSSAGARKRFLEESRALASMSHPHIAHVYETGVHHLESADVSIPWIAMELVEGMTTISAYLESHQPSTRSRIELFTQICGAIGAAHQAGVLHLDLNASNILVDQYGFPKIIDFGLTGLTTNGVAPSASFIGTRVSIAPEQAMPGTGVIGNRTDIYALGLLLVEILTGTQLQLFAGQSNEDARQQIHRGAALELFELVDGIPIGLKPLIRMMICPASKDRPESIGQVLGMLDQQEPRSSLRKKAIGLLIAFPILMAFLMWIVIDQGTHEPKDEDALSFSPEVAMEISSDNPRQEPYSPSLARVIDGISAALESSQSMEPAKVADLHASLAGNYRIAGQYDEAIVHYLDAANLREQHASVTSFNRTMIDLVGLQLFLGRVDQAETQFARIVKATNMAPLFLVDLGIAEAQISLAKGQPADSIRQIQYTESLLERLTDDEINDRLDRTVLLSDLYTRSGDRDAGVRVLKKALVLATTKYSAGSVQAAMVNISLANMLAIPGDPSSYQYPIQLAQEAIESFRDSDDQFHAIWAQRQLGNLYLRRGDFINAKMAFSSATDQMQVLLGEDHHETMLCLAYEIVSQIALGDDTETHITHYQDTLNRLSDRIGDQHPTVVSLREAFSRAVGSLDETRSGP